LGDRKGIQPVKTEWWGAGMVICLEQGADLPMAQLMPLPLTVSCFSKIQIGFTFLVPADLGSPGKGPLNGCVCIYMAPQYPKHIGITDRKHTETCNYNNRVKIPEVCHSAAALSNQPALFSATTRPRNP